MITHKSLIDTVTYFLQENLATNKLAQVSISTIENLLQLFLYNNMFRYENKIYSIEKGGPQSIPLSSTLSNIYLFEWQKAIIREVEKKDDLFGR
jgi:hypothetical protein